MEKEIEKLKKGNERFRKREFKDKFFLENKELLKGQKPFATIISCSDSRVIPEYIFDADAGELFVIRVAGNVVGDEILASVEYGIEHLKTPLLVVMGHEKCGAVTASFECYKNGKEEEGYIGELIERIKPAVIKSKDVEEAIEKNVLETIRELRERIPLINKLEKEGKLKLIGAKFYLSDESVKFLY